ncbi:hypothetical protein PYCCODRAFT_1437626 [Trametes coccinea BRFM310]|uniref:Transmembrane protein n=1 Tax=Trametes coccinea (strain BRFM310) TaxID=1353009 RepID=A0A1Y2IIC1_TRAC3|nr:hypothetical protein PYCCODRAFT_1437626 [Trametes coccinea BRFM310]
MPPLPVRSHGLPHPLPLARSFTAAVMLKSLAFRTQSSTPSNIDATTKQALLAVVQVWLDRLQAMAVVTTFFVSIDSMLYGYATASLPADSSMLSNADVLKSATLGGSIILHVCASVLAYLASFVLIRYRLDDAEDQVKHPQADRPADVQRRAASMRARAASTADSPKTASSDFALPVQALSQDLRSLISVYQVRPLWFMSRPPRSSKTSPEAPPPTGDDCALRILRSMIHTLTKCHTVVAIMSNVGFLLALIGTITYFWTSLPLALGTFASVCLGASLVASAFAIM